jgi:hypothetical protein
LKRWTIGGSWHRAICRSADPSVTHEIVGGPKAKQKTLTEAAAGVVEAANAHSK